MARQWFTEKTSPHLSKSDRRVLNCAARHLEDNGCVISNSVLTKLNMLFHALKKTQAVSAQTLIDHLDGGR